MILQEKFNELKLMIGNDIGTQFLWRRLDAIQSEVSQLQQAHTALLTRIADLDEIARLVSKEYETMRTVADELTPPEPEVCHMPELVSVLEEQEIGGTIRNWTVSSSKHEHPLAVYRLVQVHPDFHQPIQPEGGK